MLVVFGFLLAFVSAAASVPQVVSVLRTGSTTGLSESTQVAWVVSWFLWMVYAWQVSLVPLFLSDLAGLLVDGLLLFVIVRSMWRTGGPRHATTRVLAAAWPFMTVLPLLLLWGAWGLAALALGLAVLDGAGVLPQVKVALRAPSLAGLSIPAWTLHCLVAAGWIVYGFAEGVPLSAAWAWSVLPASMLILVKVIADRRSGYTRTAARLQLPGAPLAAPGLPAPLDLVSPPWVFSSQVMLPKSRAVLHA